MVRDATGAALPGVTITVAGHPELGSTLTQGNGAFDLMVAGGQLARLQFALGGYLPSERLVEAPWQNYATTDDVTMMPVDPRATSIDLSNTSDIQVARGSVEVDDAGTRQATVMVPPGTQALMLLPDGGTTPLNTMTVHATEYTVGASGPSAMPAPLPPQSAYTYAVALSTDEATDAGATQVTFSQPLPLYVEDFLGFPVGTTIPVGFYDKGKGAWLASANGVCVSIVSENGGSAQIDVNGDGMADTGAALTALGITALELQHVATLYPVGRSLWRAQLPEFSNIDLNLGNPPPIGGPPPVLDPVPNPLHGPGGCDTSGSTIRCQRQSLGQDQPIAGTPYSLHYESDRQLGHVASLAIPLSGPAFVGAVERIDLNVQVAGRQFAQSFPAQANQTTTFTAWDGTDAYGRLLQGAQPVTVLVGNTYAAPPYLQVSGFGEWGGAALTTSTQRQEVTLSKVWNGRLGNWDDKPRGLGGWTLNVHHAYDPGAQTLYFGDGTEVTPASVTSVIKSIAGNGCTGLGGDNGPATSACVNTPLAVAVGSDGSVYIADGTYCIRRVGTDGVIRTFAGQCAVTGFSGDEGPATNALFNLPSDIAFGPDGSLYIADEMNQRIRRVDPSGIIHTVAGSGPTGGGSFSGDGGLATQATLNSPNGVDVAPDGTIYIADLLNGRVRRVGPNGVIETAAGIGTNSCFNQTTKGYGGPATAAHLCGVNKVRVANDGFYLIESECRSGRPCGHRRHHHVVCRQRRRRIFG